MSSNPRLVAQGRYTREWLSAHPLIASRWWITRKHFVAVRASTWRAAKPLLVQEQNNHWRPESPHMQIPQQREQETLRDMLRSPPANGRNHVSCRAQMTSHTVFRSDSGKLRTSLRDIREQQQQLVGILSIASSCCRAVRGRKLLICQALRQKPSHSYWL